MKQTPQPPSRNQLLLVSVLCIAVGVAPEPWGRVGAGLLALLICWLAYRHGELRPILTFFVVAMPVLVGVGYMLRRVGIPEPWKSLLVLATSFATYYTTSRHLSGRRPDSPAPPDA